MASHLVVNMLQVQDLNFQYGEETLFSDVDFVVWAKDSR